jgi:hypothetical protein
MVCKITTCTNKNTHETDKHVCQTCYKKGHSCFEIKLLDKKKEVGDERLYANARRIMKDTNGKIYVRFYHGMGYETFLKRDNSNDNMKKFSTDSFQYDKKFYEFIRGYKHVGGDLLLPIEYLTDEYLRIKN